MAGRNWIIVAVAIALGLIAAVIANAWFSGMEDKQQVAQVDTGTVKIVVASQPLDYASRLTQQNIKLQDWPAASVPQGAYRTLPDALRDNPVALRPIVVGEPVLADKLSSDGRASLAALIPEGMRAFSIPVDAVNGVSGFVMPNSMVDVLLTRGIPGTGTNNEDLRSDVLLTNVQVLALDQALANPEGKPAVGRTATLAVTLTDAQRLTLATKMGTLSLVLRKVETASAALGETTQFADAAPQTVIGNRITGPRMLVNRTQGGGNNNSAPARALANVFAALAPKTGVGPASLPPSGPTMTVFRGAEPTVYPVGFSGGR